MTDVMHGLAARRFEHLAVAEAPREPDPLKGLVAGLIAGGLATLPMSAFEGRAQSVSPSGEGDWASEKVARHVGEAATGQTPRGETRRAGGTAAHFAMGAAAGGVYGLAAEYFPKVTIGFGAPFGLVVKVVADDVFLTAVGLAPPTRNRPGSHHLFSVVAHLVFGVSCEAGRRAVRQAL